MTWQKGLADRVCLKWEDLKPQGLSIIICTAKPVATTPSIQRSRSRSRSTRKKKNKKKMVGVAARNYLVPALSMLPNPMKSSLFNQNANLFGVFRLSRNTTRRFSSSSSRISMSLRAGIVGLPNVGKSTLFNAVVSICLVGFWESEGK